MENSAKTLLLVEDDQILAMAESQSLKKEGYNVIHAASGDKAIEIVRQGARSIDLILMDVDLGTGMNGAEAAKEILKDHDVPVVFLSSHTEEDVVEKTKRIVSYGYVVKNSGMAVLKASIKMAFRLHESRKKLKDTREALLEFEDKYRRLKTNIPGLDYQFALHTDGSYSFPNISSASRELFDVEPEDALRDWTFISRLIHSDDRGKFDLTVKESAEKLQPWREELRFVVNGEVRWYDCISRPELQPNGDIIWDGIVLEITSRKRAEESLRESEDRFRRLVQSTTDYIYTVKIESGRPVATFHGPGCVTVTGYTSEEYAADPDLWYRMVYDEDKQVVTEHTATALSGIEARPIEHRIIHKNGSIRWVRNTPVLVRDDRGELVDYDGLISDITERKRAEEALKKSLRDKEVLLKEIQHRVKNNLNIISSLLGLETEKLSDDRSKQVFIDAQSRIRSMSTIYEQLYSSTELDKVDLDIYLKDLGDSLLKTYSIDTGRILLTTTLATIQLDIKRAVPLGLIMNELMTNALKYAFPSGGKGEIRIDLEKSENQIMLSLSDNGVGLPVGFDPYRNNSMGLRLVKMLTEQIDGTLTVKSKKGTEVSVKFKQ